MSRLFIMHLKKATVFGLLSFSLVTCNVFAAAGIAEAQCYDVYDPNEKWNRKIYSFNMTLDKYFINPPVKIYKKFTPDFLQDRVTSVMSTAREPLTFVNNILQKEPDAAAKTFARFLTNMTLGIFGLFDFASAAGLQDDRKTFDSTMSHYDFKYGIYVMIPVLGPYTGRGIIGRIVDVFIDPVEYLFWNDTAGSLLYAGSLSLDSRIQHDDAVDFASSSIDPYATTRIAYLHARAKQERRCDKFKPTYNYQEDDEKTTSTK